MKKLTFLAALAMATALATGAQAQQPASKPVEAGKPVDMGKPAEAAAPVKPPKIMVNGVAIPASRFDLMTKAQMSRGQADSPDLQKNVKAALIRGEVVYQEALKAGLDKDPAYTAQIDLIRQQLLFRTFIENWMKNNPVKDEALKAEYNSKLKEMGEKEYKAQHILVETEDEAKQIIAQIKKGGDFAKIAKEKSKDTGSKENGGDLGWNAPGGFVKPFSDAMVALKKGELSAQPVKSQFGFHVIKLEDSRAAKPPPFEEVKERIRQAQQQAALEKYLGDLQTKAKVDEK